MSTQGKNGNGAVTNGKPENGKVATTLTVAAPKKDEQKPLPTIPGRKIDDLPPLEDRLHRLQVLFDLHKKYDKLQESLQKLKAFKIKKDGDRSYVTLMDDSRNDFTTYNPEIVQEVVKFLEEKIKEKIKTLEPQLKW